MTLSPKLLLIDDNDRTVELLHCFLQDYRYATRCALPGPCWNCPQRNGCSLTHAHNVSEARAALSLHPDLDVVLLDVQFLLPEEELLPIPPLLSQELFGGEQSGTEPENKRRWQGLAILSELRRNRSDLPVILMTSHEELGQKTLPLDWATDEFVTLAGADVFDARAIGILIERLLLLKRETPAVGGYFFGHSPSMNRLRREAQVLGRTSLPMLVLGETGTGKSALCEQVIHPSANRKGPFVSVDLSAFPETLLASELFGVAKGAFSGAVEREGRFERAHLGTLLLDEIGNLPLDVQRMLLLVLQEGKVTRLGESVPRPVQVKVIAATNIDLEEAVKQGRFREDLYARLNPAARLILPPLRERMDDLEPLLIGLLRKTFSQGPNRQLLSQYCEQAGLPNTPQVHLYFGKSPPPYVEGIRFLLSAASMQAIHRHPFPGNIRELELLVGTVALLSLADALHAAQHERAVPQVAHTIPIPNPLLQRLLRGASLQTVPPASTARTGTLSVHLKRGHTLHDVAQALERQVYEQLWSELGSFEQMAARLLDGKSAENARRVRLRFNQLGLRIRTERESIKSRS